MDTSQSIKILILAAGKGTRMKSDLPKALQPLHGKPMIRHVLKAVAESGLDERPTIIVGYGKEALITELGDGYDYVFQEEQLGTGHALAQAKAACGNADTVVVLLADQPLVKSSTILECIARHDALDAKITFTTTEVSDFEDWRKYFLSHGRILRQDDRVRGIREYKDATDEEKQIKEVNAGCCYVFNGPWLWDNIKNIKNTNATGEYYLTDLIELASMSDLKIETIKIDPAEALGATSKEDLEILEKFGL